MNYYRTILKINNNWKGNVLWCKGKKLLDFRNMIEGKRFYRMLFCLVFLHFQPEQNNLEQKYL